MLAVSGPGGGQKLAAWACGDGNILDKVFSDDLDGAASCVGTACVSAGKASQSLVRDEWFLDERIVCVVRDRKGTGHTRQVLVGSTAYGIAKTKPSDSRCLQNSTLNFNWPVSTPSHPVIPASGRHEMRDAEREGANGD